MLKHLVPIVAATLLLLIVWASSVPLFHWFGVEDATESIEQHMADWRELGIDSYEFVIRKECFCGPPGNIPVRVVVRDSLNIAAYDARTSINPTVDRIDGIPHSVPELFELARSASTTTANQAEIIFDDVFSYPAKITFDSNSDDQISYSVSQFQVNGGAE